MTSQLSENCSLISDTRILVNLGSRVLERQIVESNPAIGIKRHHENKWKRLIRSEKYGAIYASAGPRLQLIMDLLYLTDQRVVDVLSIRYSDLR